MLKKIINIILEFSLTISLSILVIALIVFNTIGNKNYTLKMLEKNNYYNSVAADIQKNIEAYTIQLGLDNQAIETLYSKEKVKKDINTLIDGIYDNKDINIDTTDITNKLEEFITNKLKENNRQASTEEEIAIQELKDDVSSVYESEITYSTKYALKIRDSYTKINKYRNPIKYTLIGVSIILLILIIINNRNLQNIFKTTSISLLSTSFLLIALKLLIKPKFQNILILNSILSKIIISIINDILKTYFTIGIFLAIISIIGIIIGVRKTKN